MQFSLKKALILSMLTLAATPAIQAVTCTQAAVYTGLGAVGLTVGKFCFTDPERFVARYDADKFNQDPIRQSYYYWCDEIAGHDKMDYEHLGWDGTKPLFKAKIKGRGWVYFIKKLWKPTENFLNFPVAVVTAIALFPKAQEAFHKLSDKACGCACN